MVLAQSRPVLAAELIEDYQIAGPAMTIGHTLRLRRESVPHALWRRYYTVRNYIRLMRNVFDRPDLARRRAGRWLARSLTAWGRGPAYGARFTLFQARGVIDGYRGRLGRTVSPRTKTRPEQG